MSVVYIYNTYSFGQLFPMQTEQLSQRILQARWLRFAAVTRLRTNVLMAVGLYYNVNTCNCGNASAVVALNPQRHKQSWWSALWSSPGLSAKLRHCSVPRCQSLQPNATHIRPPCSQMQHIRVTIFLPQTYTDSNLYFIPDASYYMYLPTYIDLGWQSETFVVGL